MGLSSDSNEEKERISLEAEYDIFLTAGLIVAALAMFQISLFAANWAETHRVEMEKAERSLQACQQVLDERDARYELVGELNKSDESGR